MNRGALRLCQPQHLFKPASPFPAPPCLADFSHMRDYLRRTLSGQLPLFSLSSDNAVVQLLGKGAPRIAESQIDSKKVRLGLRPETLQPGWSGFMPSAPPALPAAAPPTKRPRHHPAHRPTPNTHQPPTNLPTTPPQELERALKSTCEAFIMHATKLTVEPLLSFITKVTAARVAAQSTGAPKPLREQVRRGQGRERGHADGWQISG